MTNNVKMYSQNLGNCGSDIIRVKKGYLPEMTNSLGNMLQGHVVQIVHKNGKTDEVALVRDHETYGEPSGGLFIPMTQIGISLDGIKQKHSFLGNDREPAVDIDFTQIAPEARELVKTAEEAVKQSLKFPETQQNQDGKQAESNIGAYEVLPEFRPRPSLPTAEKTASSPKPKKSIFSRIRQFIR
ncbi:MAG: hypothetical protein KHX55_07215 [Proteobacteria bacterium]|nr:hypothetical protein [Pseudomonadota bacterium]